MHLGDVSVPSAYPPQSSDEVVHIIYSALVSPTIKKKGCI